MIDETMDLFARQVRDQLADQEPPTIQEAFETFHAEHPEVYAELVMRARQWQARGKKRLGIGMLWEVMRWNLTIDCSDEDFMLNNNFRSRYARRIAEQETDLADVFETRKLRAQ